MIKSNSYRDELESLLMKAFVPAGYKITKNTELDPTPESSKYKALSFSLDGQDIIYRKGKVTADRPGAFLAIWRRPPASITDSNKPIPFKNKELDYLFVQVEEHSNVTSTKESTNTPKSGMFIFPVSLLVKKGIVSSEKSKGKTGFRVFPPWSQDRGMAGTKIFSESGKKTQRWQLPYFVEIDHGSIDIGQLIKIFDYRSI